MFLPPAVQAAPHPGEVTASCSAYDEHLRRAREALDLDDRGAALGELRRAREALAECLREDAGETALATR